MKRRFVRQLLLVGCLLILAPAVLAACGSGDDDDTGDTGAETTEVADSTTTDEEESTETEAATEAEETGTSEATQADEASTSEATGTDAEGTSTEAEGTSTEDQGAATEAEGTATQVSPYQDPSAENTWEGTITFGDLNWTSAVVHNRIAQYIIEHGYGYETDTIQGNMIPIFQGITDGQVQATMEIWTDNFQAVWNEAVKKGTVVDLGLNYPEASQGWFVPTYVIEGDEERGIEPMAPDLKTVFDLPQYKDLFKDPAQPDKGRFVNGVPGWLITDVNGLKLQAYGLADGYTNFKPGSSAAIFASLTSAYETGEPWLGYLWSPHWVFAQMDMTKIEQPEYTDECWNKLSEAAKSGGEAPEEACAPPSIEVHVTANTEFAEQAPGIAAFLTNYTTTEEQTNNFLLWMHENEATAEETAIHFLKEHTDLWTQWVPDDIASKVTEALESGAGFANEGGE